MGGNRMFGGLESRVYIFWTLLLGGGKWEGVARDGVMVTYFGYIFVGQGLGRRAVDCRIRGRKVDGMTHGLFFRIPIEKGRLG